MRRFSFIAKALSGSLNFRHLFSFNRVYIPNYKTIIYSELRYPNNKKNKKKNSHENLLKQFA